MRYQSSFGLSVFCVHAPQTAKNSPAPGSGAKNSQDVHAPVGDAYCPKSPL
jgi:hypothetical protein